MHAGAFSFASFSNNDRKMIGFILTTAGAGKIAGKCAGSENCAPSFTWQVANRQALELLQRILPYLRTYKPQRTALALSDYAACTPRNGRYYEQVLRRRNAFRAPGVRALLDALMARTAGFPTTSSIPPAAIA